VSPLCDSVFNTCLYRDFIVSKMNLDSYNGLSMSLPIFGPRINMQRKRWECKKIKKNVKENKKIY